MKCSKQKYLSFNTVQRIVRYACFNYIGDGNSSLQ